MLRGAYILSITLMAFVMLIGLCIKYDKEMLVFEYLVICII